MEEVPHSLRREIAYAVNRKVFSKLEVFHDFPVAEQMTIASMMTPLQVTLRGVRQKPLGSVLCMRLQHDRRCLRQLKGKYAQNVLHLWCLCCGYTCTTTANSKTSSHWTSQVVWCLEDLSLTAGTAGAPARSCRQVRTSARPVTWRTASGCCTRALWRPLTPTASRHLSWSPLRCLGRLLYCASSMRSTTSCHVPCGERPALECQCSWTHVQCQYLLLLICWRDFPACCSLQSVSEMACWVLSC